MQGFLLSIVIISSFWKDSIFPAGAVQHRVFPAAQKEDYTTGGEIAGCLWPSELVFVGSDFALQNSVVKPAIERFKKSLYRLPDFIEMYEINPEKLDLFHIKTVDIQVISADTSLFHGVDESYFIHIDDLTDVATIRTQTVFGALYALETFAQLLTFGWMDTLKDEQPVYLIHDIPLEIYDFPAYPYRGLLLDTARHYHPLSLILDTLYTMSLNKLNVLHWHLVDDQSFPYQMRTYPEIAEQGSYPPFPHRIYTTDDIHRVVQEAYKLGIRVIPEFDLPGHTRAIGKAHPELMAFCPNPGDVIDATNEEVYEFVQNVYDDLASLFPDSMIHVGGDEVSLDCWKKSVPIQNWMMDHNMTEPVELYEYFETRLLEIVNKSGKTPIVWQEVFNLNLTITSETIVDVWKGFDIATIEAAAAANLTMILSGCWYLDHLDKKWQDFYDCDPRNFAGDTRLMVGGHACMWGEHVDSTNIVSRIWPRASATAERLWKGDIQSAKMNIDERIHTFRCRMVQQGIAAAPTVRHGGFCPHEAPYLTENNIHRQQQIECETPLKKTTSL